MQYKTLLYNVGQYKIDRL